MSLQRQMQIFQEVKSRGKTIKRASVQADLQSRSTTTLHKKSRPSSANVQDASTVDLPATSYTDEKPTEKAKAQRKWKRENVKATQPEWNLTI